MTRGCSKWWGSKNNAENSLDWGWGGGREGGREICVMRTWLKLASEKTLLPCQLAFQTLEALHPEDICPNSFLQYLQMWSSPCWLWRWTQWALCQRAARAGCSERRASWELSHSNAGRGSGLTNKGIVLWYLNRKIGVSQGEYSDQQGTWPGVDTVCRHRRSRVLPTWVQAARSPEDIDYMPRALTFFCLWSGQGYSRPSVGEQPHSLSACLPDNEVLHLVALRVSWKSRGLGKGEKS